MKECLPVLESHGSSRSGDGLDDANKHNLAVAQLLHEGDEEVESREVHQLRAAHKG